MSELINTCALPSTMTDIHGRLGLVGAISLVQDNICQFFRMLKCDGFIMEPIIHCFWVVTKTNIKLLDDVEWLDKIHIKTYLSKKTNVRLFLTTEISKDDGRVVVVCNQELCAMGSIDRKVKLVKDTFFPNNVQVKENGFVFKKIDNFDIGKAGCQLYNISFSNIDFCLHTNNLEYVKFMLNCYPLEFWQNRKIKEFDIHYLSESRFGDCLSVYSFCQDNCCQFAVLNDNNTITKGLIVFDKC